MTIFNFFWHFKRYCRLKSFWERITILSLEASTIDKILWDHLSKLGVIVEVRSFDGTKIEPYKEGRLFMLGFKTLFTTMHISHPCCLSSHWPHGTAAVILSIILLLLNNCGPVFHPLNGYTVGYYCRIIGLSALTRGVDSTSKGPWRELCNFE